MSKGRTKPNCHPNRPHYAKGLCAACYHTQAKKRKTKQQKHKEPVVVTHTHEVIRQVQHEEKQTMAAPHENDKPKAKDAPVTVKSDVGETGPPQVFGGDGVTPIAEFADKYKDLKEKQAELDEKRRQRAVEDSGNVQTTEKHKHG